MNYSITVSIATRNRPETLVRAINSVLNQSYNKFFILISDNSTNDDTEKEIKNIHDDRIIYKRRVPDYQDAFQHFNAIIEDINTPYFMIFHDDDEMLPNMVEKLYTTIKKHPEIAAVASNGIIWDDEKNEKKGTFYYKELNPIVLKDPKDLVLRNVEKKIAPFPSYMYCKNNLDDIRFSKEICGKYGDTAFLLQLLEKHHVIYVPDILIRYHLSLNQDSAHHDFVSFLKLIKIFEKYVSKKQLTSIRINNIYDNIRFNQIQKGKIEFNKKYIKIFAKYSLNNYFIKYVIRLFKLYKE